MNAENENDIEETDEDNELDNDDNDIYDNNEEEDYLQINNLMTCESHNNSSFFKTVEDSQLINKNISQNENPQVSGFCYAKVILFSV